LTLPLPTQVDDPLVQQCLDAIAMQFPVGQQNIATAGQIVTALPAKAPKGTQLIYVADQVNGVLWNMLYDGEGGLPWKYLGGPPLWAEVATNQARENTVYGDLATTGPAVTLPLKGDYDVEIGTWAAATGGTAHSIFMSYEIGTTAATDADALFYLGQLYSANSSDGASMSRRRRKTGLSAVTLTAKYRSASPGAGFWQNRWMSVTPVRVG